MPSQERISFSETVWGRIEGRTLVVTIDNQPVNALSATVRQGLVAAVDHAQADAEIDALVVTGAGRIFIGGADITEFGKPPVDPILPEVIAKLEQAAKPVIAAINGAALGGGLEVALACHARVMAETANVALPEVKLGIVPGAGGTQRLPRLVGIAGAIDIIGSGRSVKAKEAMSLGIVDAVAADAVTEALTMVANGVAIRRTGELTVCGEPAEKIEEAAAKVIKKARGQTAPKEAVRLVKLAATADLATGLADERATFLRLRDSEEAAALRHVFFAEREAAKIEFTRDAKPREIGTVGVVGAGLMGSGISVAALDAGYRLVVIEQSDEAAQKGLERIIGLLERNRKSGRIDEAGLADRIGRLTVTAEFGKLAEADLVIEAVFDDLQVKSELFRRLSATVRGDTILATNTSYLDPEALADCAANPERVLGLHFFSPANVMRLVEVVRCARTTPDVLATGIGFARKLGKLPIVCGVTEGFIGNSIFSAYRREAEFLLEDGALPHEIDKAMEDFGMAMGPFAVFDLAGLEIAWARRKRMAPFRDPSERYVDIPDRLCEAGRFGRKTGRGWYLYEGEARKVDPDVTAMIEAARAAKNITPREISAGEIVSRLLAAMAAEGRKLLEQGIALRESDIDLVLINGYGFPAHKGGPMFQASRAGT